MADLTGQGRRWLISPWITSDLPATVLRAGDRVILRGDPADFYHRFSNLETFSALAAIPGVSIRRNKQLHAKVYAQEGAGGCVWTGSANLSKAARYGQGQGGANIEVMAGPFTIDPGFTQQLETLWEQSRPLTTDTLSQEVDAYAKTRAALQKLQDKALDVSVLAVRLSFYLTAGACTLKPQWLGLPFDEEPWRSINYPSVPYVNTDSAFQQKWRRYVDKIRRDLVRELMVSVTGEIGRGVYIIRAEDQGKVERELNRLEQYLSSTLAPEFEAERANLLKDFMTRFNSTYREFVRANRLMDSRVNPDKVMLAAERAFNEFAAKHPFGINAEYFLPLASKNGGDDNLKRAILTARQRQDLGLQEHP